jgi:hypothetical protein
MLFSNETDAQRIWSFLWHYAFATTCAHSLRYVLEHQIRSAFSANTKCAITSLRCSRSCARFYNLQCRARRLDVQNPGESVNT